MGVTGLWRLLEPAGKPVPLETLDGKILAVDISIWLHQMIKGFQDAQGAPLANAHLFGLFHRLCKLLYYRIRPVFVFDGGVPALKRSTIEKRQINKAKLKSSSEKLREQLMNLMGSHAAINTILSNKALSPKKGSPRKLATLNSNEDEALFKLPPMEASLEEKSDTEEGSSADESSDSCKHKVMDLHTANLDSATFKSLPLREKYDVLHELKETRKQSSWGRLHELPTNSDNFSGYQMERLLKRRKLQMCIEETEKEMGGDYLSLTEMEKLLNEEGISTTFEDFSNKRIASDENTRYLFIKDVKQAVIEAKKNDMAKTSTPSGVETQEINDSEEEDLERAIKMSLEGGASENKPLIEEEYVSSSDESIVEVAGSKMAAAKAFMLENTDLTERAINKILTKQTKGKKETKEEKRRKEFVTFISDDSSNEDDFEEVEEMDVKQPAIELNLPYDGTDLKDDIFADVFLKTDIKTTEDDKVEVKNDAEEKHTGKEIEIKEIMPVIPKIKEMECEEPKTDDKIISQITPAIPKITEIECEEPKTDNKIVSQITPVIPKIKEIECEEPKTDDRIVSQIMPDKHKIKEIEQHNEPKIDSKIISLESHTAVVQDKPIVEEILNLESVESERSPSPDENDDIASPQRPEVESELKLLSDSESADEPAAPPQTIDDLKLLASDIEKQHDDLMKQYGKMDRMGRNISEEMTKDAKELLSLFGIPYVVSPMEAEAQCAFLELANMSQGTITDDSDIWLFGGQTVYKNFFDQRKHVLQYLSGNIERLFNLTRENMILLALLVGSDYTVGISGVGPVTALEILAEFPPRLHSTQAASSSQNSKLLGGLIEFKQWLRSKRGGNTLRNKLKNVAITDEFPSFSVVQAYLDPKVDTNKEKFTWGTPDVTAIREFARAKFGWSQSKTDEILNPVLKRLDVKHSQKSIQSFFKTKNVADFESEEKLSKRVKSAIERSRLDPNDAVADTEKTDDKKRPARRKKKDKEEAINIEQETVIELEGMQHTEMASEIPKKRGKRTQKLILPGPSKINKVESEKIIFEKLHKKDLIPQREKDKEALLQNKLRAIELYRKSKLGPDRLKTKKRRTVKPKEDAGLSESSDSN